MSRTCTHNTPSMLRKLKESWHKLKDAEPGERFTRHFERRRRSGGSGLWKPLFIGGGVLVMAAGIFFLPAPGPGFLILFLGAGMIAQESRPAARALDRTEILLRRVAAWGLRVWKRSSLPVKAIIVLVVLALAASAAYLTYRLLFAR